MLLLIFFIPAFSLFQSRKNLILKDVVEERWVDTSVYAGANDNEKSSKVIVAKRNLSQAMIPGKHLVKVEVSQQLYKEDVAPFVASDDER